MRVKSQGDRQGSTFIVALPISAVRSEEEASHEPATFAEIDPAEVELPSLSGVTALIVDDEADARILLDRLIQEGRSDRDRQQRLGSASRPADGPVDSS